MSRFSDIRQWIDDGWHGPPLRLQSRRSGLAFLLPLCGLALLRLTILAQMPNYVFWPLVAIVVLWAAFVIWRGLIFFRAFGRKSDQQYDRKDKFKLSAEHHSSESATAASMRRKQHGR